MCVYFLFRLLIHVGKQTRSSRFMYVSHFKSALIFILLFPCYDSFNFLGYHENIFSFIAAEAMLVWLPTWPHRLFLFTHAKSVLSIVVQKDWLDSYHRQPITSWHLWAGGSSANHDHWLLFCQNVITNELQSALNHRQSLEKWRKPIERWQKG